MATMEISKLQLTALSVDWRCKVFSTLPKHHTALEQKPRSSRQHGSSRQGLKVSPISNRDSPFTSPALTIMLQ